MMTTLQIVLAIVGITMVAAIVIYNLVQERRFRKEADRLFSHKRDDIMLGEAVRTDPSRRQTETRIQLTGHDEDAPEARQAVEEADAPLYRGRMDDDFALPDSYQNRTESPEEDLPPPLGALPEKREALTPVEDEEPAAPRAATKPAMSRTPEPMTAAAKLATRGDAKAATTEQAGYLPPHIAAMHETRGSAALAAAPTSTPASTPAPAAPAAVQGASSLDPATEYIARLKFASPAFSSYSSLLNTLRRIGKPIRCFGLGGDGRWEMVTSNSRSAYSQMELGLQLADRSGAIAQDQLDAFCRALYTFAADAGGAVICPEKDEALERAQELDMFCMNVDVLMGLNVIAGDAHPFTSEAVHTQASAIGLTLERDGIYYARDAQGHSLFTLTNQEETPFPRDGRGLVTRGVTLLFDVPRVADGVKIFDRMTDFGFSLADRLSGRLVDDNGRAVSNDSLNRDRSRLVGFYARMEKQGIPAGGERALRLFA